ncbi:MAG: hypothetical protein AB7F19_00810 [Candidatus Babeliales bacterium]
MNISHYTSYFHDGSIIAIQHKNTELLISMESAELSRDDLTEDITLSEHSSLKGILHLKRIKSIYVDEQAFIGKLVTHATKSSRILDFSIKGTKVHFFIEWSTIPVNPLLDEFNDIVVEADEIYWENKPDLYDHFGKG